MPRKDIVGRHKTEIPTPALLIDMAAVERNIAAMAGFFSEKACNLRPHCKTHKLPEIALKEIGAGAVGITCATLREAEVMLHSGVGSVLIANEIVSKAAIEKMVSLAGEGELIVGVDHIENAGQIADVAKVARRRMNVLVEVNIGLNRCGVAPGVSALKLAGQVAALDNLAFRGMMGYEGSLPLPDLDEKRQKCSAANKLLADTARLIEQEGIPVDIVSGGGSNTYALTGTYPGFTEVQAGSYSTMDVHNKECGMPFEETLTVLTTVVSRPEKHRAVIDAGKKAISSEFGMPAFTTKRLALFQLNEEHGHVRIVEEENDLKVGDLLELRPTHGCTTLPLYTTHYLMRDDHVEKVVEVQARR